jgi:TPP-dependent pyruvate/acetoin dehydrogenase alpha subunit
MQHATETGGAAFAQSMAHRHMIRLRLLSARMVLLQRLRPEKVASHHACFGEEAAFVGATRGLRADDWVFPGVREWGAGLVRGIPIAEYVHHAFGSKAARAKGHAPPDFVSSRAARVAPASGVPGAHLPQAVGAAWAAKIRRDDVAALVLFGAEVTSTGDFHNAMNFAGVMNAPCVFVCRGDGSAARAVAYGVASAKVDGMDASAVERRVREAIERAAAGKGATLIEAVTKPVTSLDDAALGSDAVLGDLPHDEAFVREVRGEIDAAIAAAEAAGAPDPATIFQDVYAAPPTTLAAQEKELRSWRR